MEANKQWVRSHRKDSRDSHRGLDGKMVYIGEDFNPGLGRPGDPRAPAGEVVNCCCMLVEGVLLDDEIISPDGRSVVRKMGSVTPIETGLPEGRRGLPKNPKRIDGMVAENVTNEYFLRATLGKGSFT